MEKFWVTGFISMMTASFIWVIIDWIFKSIAKQPPIYKKRGYIAPWKYDHGDAPWQIREYEKNKIKEIFITLEKEELRRVFERLVAVRRMYRWYLRSFFIVLWIFVWFLLWFFWY